jgi:hypothetical protein
VIEFDDHSTVAQFRSNHRWGAVLGVAGLLGAAEVVTGGRLPFYVLILGIGGCAELLQRVSRRMTPPVEELAIAPSGVAWRRRDESALFALEDIELVVEGTAVESRLRLVAGTRSITLMASDDRVPMFETEWLADRLRRGLDQARAAAQTPYM